MKRLISPNRFEPSARRRRRSTLPIVTAVLGLSMVLSACLPNAIPTASDRFGGPHREVADWLASDRDTDDLKQIVRDFSRERGERSSADAPSRGPSSSFDDHADRSDVTRENKPWSKRDWSPGSKKDAPKGDRGPAPVKDPAGQPEAPAEEVPEEPAEQPEVPAEEVPEEPAEQPSDEPSEEPSESPDEEPAEEPVEAPAEQPDETPASPTAPAGQTADARWNADADAVVSSWADAATAARGGAEVIHLRGGSYGNYQWNESDVFIRNVPGQRVRIGGTFVAQAPDVTLAGVEVQGRFEGREQGNNATLFRSLLTTGGVTFNGTSNGSESALLGRLIEVHKPERRTVNTGNVVTVNRGASLLVEGSHLEGNSKNEGADGHLDTIQLIQGGQNLTVRDTYLGASRNSALHLITGPNNRLVFEDVFIDGPERNLSGIGWEMRATNVTMNNVTAFRPYWSVSWQSSFSNSITIENSTFYDVPEQKRPGQIMFSGNDNRSSAFPGATVGAAKPSTPQWATPAWWNELG